MILLIQDGFNNGQANRHEPYGNPFKEPLLVDVLMVVTCHKKKHYEIYDKPLFDTFLISLPNK